MNWIREKIGSLKSKNLYRSLRTAARSTAARIDFGSGEMLNFSSNDYLGLADNGSVIRKARESAELYGAGSRASRLVSGTMAIHSELEKKIAEFKKKEASLVFTSGYAANIGIINALLGESDAIIMDRLNHASLIDAAKMNPARLLVYPHKDSSALEKILKKSGSYRRRFIVTDTIFSMDGDMAPLNEIASLAKKYGTLVLTDEAHATGVFGANGRGVCEYLGEEEKIDFHMGTLSKALGSQGAFAAGSKDFIELLVNCARPFIYTTAIAPALCGAAIEALDIVSKSAEPRITLLKNAKYLREKLSDAGFDTLGSCSQIIPVLTGGAAATAALSEKLFNRGIYAPPIRPPTVPENMCRLRFSLSSSHSSSDMDYLVSSLRESA